MRCCPHRPSGGCNASMKWVAPWEDSLNSWVLAARGRVGCPHEKIKIKKQTISASTVQQVQWWKLLPYRCRLKIRECLLSLLFKLWFDYDPCLDGLGKYPNRGPLVVGTDTFPPSREFLNCSSSCCIICIPNLVHIIFLGRGSWWILMGWGIITSDTRDDRDCCTGIKAHCSIVTLCDTFLT